VNDCRIIVPSRGLVPVGRVAICGQLGVSGADQVRAGGQPHVQPGDRAGNTGPALDKIA
jgi:hypothetical protein